jgi:sugar lactone lactonase YvrE
MRLDPAMPPARGSIDYGKRNDSVLSPEDSFLGRQPFCGEKYERRGQKKMKVSCVAATGDRTGEGAVWHEAHNAVYWTDINRFLIHRYTLADQCVKTWIFDEPVTALTLTAKNDELVVVLASRVIFWTPATDDRRDQGYRIEGWPEVRFNDARVDPRGSLWLGSMHNNVNPDGSDAPERGTEGVLCRLDADGKTTVFRRDIAISNTVVWSPDRKRFYTGDSLANVIWVFDYDAATGTISNERPFFKDYTRGLPDGSTIDSEGYLWNCRYGGGCVVRVAPDGKVDRVLEMPVPNITTCTFGGKGQKTLFITTAGASKPNANRLAGSLFAAETPFAGLPENRFGKAQV